MAATQVPSGRQAVVPQGMADREVWEGAGEPERVPVESPVREAAQARAIPEQEGEGALPTTRAPR